jgi:urea transport system substrate-binding protein
MSVSIAEECKAIGVEYLKVVPRNCFQTVDKQPKAKKFVAAFKAKFGEKTGGVDPMEAAYIMVLHVGRSGEKKESSEGKKCTTVITEAEEEGGLWLQRSTREGTVTMNTNHHLSEFVRIGKWLKGHPSSKAHAPSLDAELSP